jgi:branched-chain amino acid transport system substrate-binding protein
MKRETLKGKNVTGFVLVVVGLLFLISIVAWPHGAMAQDPIKIGVPYPMTGPYAADGAEIIAGVTMAVEEINDQGGLLGRPLEVITADTKALSPEDVDTAAKILDRQDVDVFIAGYQNYPACLVFGEYDILYLSNDANSFFRNEYLKDPEMYWNVIQMAGVEANYGMDAFRTMTKLIPYRVPSKKVAIFTAENDYTMNISRSFKNAAIDAGWEVVIDELHPWGTTEFGVQMAKIRGQDLIIFASIIDLREAAAFMREFLKRPTNSIVYYQYSPSIPEFLDVVGDDSNGIVWQIENAPVPGPKADVWTKNYIERFKRNPGFGQAALLYDTVSVWAQGVRQVGKIDQRAIAKAILGSDYNGVTGKYAYNAEDQYVKTGYENVPMHFYQIQNGKHVLLYLDDQPLGKFMTPPWLKAE